MQKLLGGDLGDENNLKMLQVASEEIVKAERRSILKGSTEIDLFEECFKTERKATEMSQMSREKMKRNQSLSQQSESVLSSKLASKSFKSSVVLPTINADLGRLPNRNANAAGNLFEPLHSVESVDHDSKDDTYPARPPKFRRDSSKATFGLRPSLKQAKKEHLENNLEIKMIDQTTSQNERRSDSNNDLKSYFDGGDSKQRNIGTTWPTKITRKKTY